MPCRVRTLNDLADDVRQEQVGCDGKPPTLVVGLPPHRDLDGGLLRGFH
jgi:hypothetical protein